MATPYEAPAEPTPRAGTIFGLDDLGLLAALALIAVAWRGYDFGGGNQSVQLVVLKHELDPSLYLRDALIESFDGYATFFFMLLAALVRWVGHLEALAFGLYASFQAVALAALFVLALTAFGSRKAAGLACLLYIARPAALGAEFAYSTRLTHAHVASGLLLWAAWLYVRGRPRMAFLLMGLVANLHALYAAHLAALLAFASLLRLRSMDVRRLLVSFGLFLLGAAPVLVWIWRSSEALTPGRENLWLGILHERSAIHVFPSVTPPAVASAFLLVLVLIGLALLRCPAREGYGILILQLGVGTLLLSGIAVLVEVQGTSLTLMRAQLLRSTRWLPLLALPVVGRLLEVSLSRGGTARAGAVLVVIGAYLDRPALLALALVLLALQPGGERPLATVVSVAAALVVASHAGVLEVPRQFGELLGDRLRLALGNPTLIAGVALLLCLWGGRGSSRRVRGLLGASALGTSLWLAADIERGAREERAGEPWYDVQVWVRDHTARDSLFLTPPYEQGFRVFSERSIVGEWKDGTQQFFSAAYAFKWWRRMGDLKGRRNAFDAFATERVVELAHKYEADYVVFNNKHPLELPAVFANERFSVYRMDAP